MAIWRVRCDDNILNLSIDFGPRWLYSSTSFGTQAAARTVSSRVWSHAAIRRDDMCRTLDWCNRLDHTITNPNRAPQLIQTTPPRHTRINPTPTPTPPKLQIISKYNWRTRMPNMFSTLNVPTLCEHIRKQYGVERESHATTWKTAAMFTRSRWPSKHYVY